MEFITLRETVSFLSQSAPAPWVHRALLWMVQAGELTLYADKLRVIAYSDVVGLTLPLLDNSERRDKFRLDAAIIEKYPKYLSDQIIGKSPNEFVYDDPFELEGWLNIDPIQIGFVIFLTKLDWQNAILECDFIGKEVTENEWLFPEQDCFKTELPDPTYKVSISGLKFEAGRIELLLPSAQLSASIERGTSPNVTRHVGRPRKWDWDGAMAHIVAKAQTPDGLPTGHGAQAKIEAIIADWFETQTGDSPAISQIRSKASRIMAMVEKG